MKRSSRSFNAQPWQAYTPTFNGSPTTANVALFWMRLGDTLFIQGSFQVTVVNASDAAFTIPFGFSVDTTKVAGSRLHTYGKATRLNATSIADRVVGYNSSYATSLVISDRGQAGPVLGQVGWDTVVANNEYIILNAWVPINGWKATR